MKTAVTIAGSDSGGGAGIQADIKTMITNGVYAMSAVTALTAQNTTGVQGVFEVPPEFLAMQLDSIFTDIRPDAVKVGMIVSTEQVSVIAEKLQKYQAENIVIDPVMMSTSGTKLINDNAIDLLKEKLFPMASVITPNIPEAGILSGIQIETSEDMKRAVRIISEKYHCAVLCKGGHSHKNANDVLYVDESYHWFLEKHIDNPNNHGTGCTLSSAIASNLAKGQSLIKSVDNAKKYISGALGAMLDLGNGCGPLNHAFQISANPSGLQ